MVDQWLQKELNEKLQLRQLVVVMDPEQQLDQLIPLWEKESWQVLTVDTSLTEEWQRIREELFLRVEIEKQEKKPTIIYSQRPKKLLSFLYDYTETHGVVDFSNPEEWLRRKLFSETGLQIQLSKKELLTAAKASVGKDIKWWKSVLQGLTDVVNLDIEILPFLSETKEWEKQQAPEVIAYVRQKLFTYTNQPSSDKKLEILAEEVANQLLSNILKNELKEDEVWYINWLDSHQYLHTLKSYINKFSLPTGINHWEVNSNHCFKKIDDLQLKDVVDNLHNAAFKTKYLPIIRKRADNRKNPLVPTWWKDIISVLSFDTSKTATLKSLKDCVNYYTTEYHQLDRSIRNLYQSFLNQENIIKPLQEYYQNINQELIEKWFLYKQDYQTNQQGHLVDLIKNNSKKLAIIVGDGVRWEIADAVASKMDTGFEVQKKVMFADLPSETEHNMSALYVGNNRVMKIHNDREKELLKLTGKEITFKKLVDINATMQDNVLVLTYKDIDSAGEKLQLDAIKLFAEFESVLQTKIQELLLSGYDEVHLVTDHGFVLTGLLSEADKLDLPIDGINSKSERYIRSEKKQTNEILWSFPKVYEQYNYLNVASSDRPFRTPGVYGFSHGGFTLQEVIIPNFKFTKKGNNTPALEIFISNKEELKEVNGDFFKIKLAAGSSGNSLFEDQRAINIILYKDNTELERIEKIVIQKDQQWDKELSLYNHQELTVIVEDSSSQEKLDQVTVYKSSARDLGGLF